MYKERTKKNTDSVIYSLLRNASLLEYSHLTKPFYHFIKISFKCYMMFVATP